MGNFKDNNVIALNKPSGVAVQGGSKVKINIDALLDSLKYDQTNRPNLFIELIEEHQDYY